MAKSNIIFPMVNGTILSNFPCITNNGKFIPQFSIKDSDVFNSLEHYEIEIELNNYIILTLYATPP